MLQIKQISPLKKGGRERARGARKEEHNGVRLEFRSGRFVRPASLNYLFNITREGTRNYVHIAHVRLFVVPRRAEALP